MLTRSGLGASVAAIVLAAGGLWWHYEELLVLAGCVAVAVAVALWGSRFEHRARIARRITAPRVARGDPIRVIYRANNPSRRRTPSAVIVDRCDDAEIRVPLPAIPADDRTEVDGAIPTRRRGVFDVGPWVLERLDPFGLAVGRRAADQVSSVIVHPRIHALHGPYGMMHTVEDEALLRRAASDPLSGFVSLREYVDGDDPRLIHWPTSARMGTLMLREHVELRRPEFTVVLDAAEHVASPDDFEEMVDVAASIAVHALRNGVEVLLRSSSPAFPGSARPLERETQVLDLLAPVTQSEAVAPLAAVFSRGLDHTTIVFVTGPDGPSSTFAHTSTGSGHLSIIRIGDGATTGPGIALAAADAEEFVQRWRPWQ